VCGGWGAKRDLWLAGNSEANFSCGQCNQQHEVGDDRPLNASSRFCLGCPPLLSSYPSCISRGRIGDRHHGFAGQGKVRGADHRRWRLSHTKGRAVLLSKCWLGRRGKTVAWQVARRGDGNGSRCLSDPRARSSQEAGFRAAAWVGGPGSPRRQKGGSPGANDRTGREPYPGRTGLNACLGVRGSMARAVVGRQPSDGSRSASPSAFLARGSQRRAAASKPPRGEWQVDAEDGKALLRWRDQHGGKEEGAGAGGQSSQAQAGVETSARGHRGRPRRTTTSSLQTRRRLAVDPSAPASGRWDQLEARFGGPASTRGSAHQGGDDNRGGRAGAAPAKDRFSLSIPTLAALPCSLSQPGKKARAGSGSAGKTRHHQQGKASRGLWLGRKCGVEGGRRRQRREGERERVWSKGVSELRLTPTAVFGPGRGHEHGAVPAGPSTWKPPAGVAGCLARRGGRADDAASSGERWRPPAAPCATLPLLAARQARRAQSADPPSPDPSPVVPLTPPPSLPPCYPSVISFSLSLPFSSNWRPCLLARPPSAATGEFGPWPSGSTNRCATVLGPEGASLPFLPQPTGA